MTEDTTTAIKALVKAQSEMTRAAKDANNPHFGSKYADLAAVQDACMPALQKNGFAVVYHITREDGKSYVSTKMLHESGWEAQCDIPLVVDKNSMQGLGSAITYARRYGLLCLSGVAPEDDDGNKAAANPPKREQPRYNPDQPGTGRANEAPAAAPIEDDHAAEANHTTACLHAIDVIVDITDQMELRGYWVELCKQQPDVARDPSVIAAKDERKALLSNQEQPE